MWLSRWFRPEYAAQGTALTWHTGQIASTTKQNPPAPTQTQQQNRLLQVLLCIPFLRDLEQGLWLGFSSYLKQVTPTYLKALAAFST